MMEEIRTLISEGKTVSLTVKGNSMNPFMVHLRDEMTLGPWKEEDLRKGTVALVLDTYGNHLIHRIIKVDKDTVTHFNSDLRQELVRSVHWVSQLEGGDGLPSLLREVQSRLFWCHVNALVLCWELSF